MLPCVSEAGSKRSDEAKSSSAHRKPRSAKTNQSTTDREIANEEAPAHQPIDRSKANEGSPQITLHNLNFLSCARPHLSVNPKARRPRPAGNGRRRGCSNNLNLQLGLNFTANRIQSGVCCFSTAFVPFVYPPLSLIDRCVALPASIDCPMSKSGRRP